VSQQSEDVAETCTVAIAPEFRMGLRPTHRNENRSESARVRSSGRGTAKVVVTLDKARPFPSLIWNVRFEPICVAPPFRQEGG
jgi:hypothetical protein